MSERNDQSKHMSYRALMILIIYALVVMANGCRRVYTYAPVAGTITKGGQPLAGVQVIFYPDPELHTEGPRSFGLTDETGHYRLRTDGGENGVVVGHHMVCIVDPVSNDNIMDSIRPREAVPSNPKETKTSIRRPKRKESKESKVPAIYGQVSKTPLKAEVRSGGIQTFDFDIH